MKKLILGSIFCALFAMIIVSCSKTENGELLIEDTQDVQTSNPQIETRGPVLFAPDLTITNITSPLTIAQGPCPGLPQADGTCSGGSPVNFNLQIKLSNVGTAAIPPGTAVDIAWVEFGRPRVVTTETLLLGLPVNGSVTINGPAWVLGCPTGLPIQLVSKQYFAVADHGNAIVEVDENNNYSTRYKVCDDL
ncbi:MAG: hypothetical protein AB8H03_08295 [Saprospiraceae bacterium]